MIQEGQIVLFEFPQTDQAGRKLRPALVIRALPGPHDDWLICVISSKLHQEVHDVDIVVSQSDGDFTKTGLKFTSLIRVTRVSVVEGKLFKGTIGMIGGEILERVRSNLGRWIIGQELGEEEGESEVE